MDAFRSVSADAGARDFMRPSRPFRGRCGRILYSSIARSRSLERCGGFETALAIFARRGAGARAIGLADVAGLRRILGDIIAGILGLIGGDRVQLIRLLGIDLLRRALGVAAGQGQRGEQRDESAVHAIPRSGFGRNHNARAGGAGA